MEDPEEVLKGSDGFPALKPRRITWISGKVFLAKQTEADSNMFFLRAPAEIGICKKSCGVPFPTPFAVIKCIAATISHKLPLDVLHPAQPTGQQAATGKRHMTCLCHCMAESEYNTSLGG